MTTLREEVSFVVMVRNEEYWIEHAIRPLATTGLPVFVADTGSTDDTEEVLLALQMMYDNVHIELLGEITPTEMGRVREYLSSKAATFWIYTVDGDEIHTPEGLKTVLDQEISHTFRAGFTTLQALSHSDGKFYPTSRQNAHKIHRQDAQWVGEYPWESTTEFPATTGDSFFYFTGGYHAFHMRFLHRSSKDELTYMRPDKIDYYVNDPTGDPIDVFDIIGPPFFYNPYFHESEEDAKG